MKQVTELLNCDCLYFMQMTDDNSVDAIITDPPYGLAFMNKHWDYQVPSVEIWREALRVLKPGGHLLSFGGTRTYHRMVVNIEDAGFEIRDQIQWIYGSGFPKSMGVSKAIDKAAGAERERIPGGQGGVNTSDEALTDDAKQWQGWGTALKPANEPIVLARKPLSEKTVAKNVLKWGTGALNIDASRLATTDKVEQGRAGRGEVVSESYGKKLMGTELQGSNTQGRWPANVLFDEEAAAVLDGQSGTLKSGAFKQKKLSANTKQPGGWQTGNRTEKDFGPATSGGASRFFYVAKASKRERGVENKHPTVKPVKLMEYLCKLITPPTGIILDPFCGSGSTGVAAKRLGFGFMGCEREEEYYKIAKKRINGRT